MKKYLVTVVLLCALLSVMLLISACGGSSDTTTAESTTEQPVDSTPAQSGNQQPDEKVTYTVIIKDQNGNAVEGVEVQICEGGTCKKPNVTDAEGKVSFSFKPNGGVLEVQINGENSVTGYVYPTEKIAVPEGETTINVEIEAQSEISVSASGLFGEKYADMVVSLYNSKDDTLVDMKTTGENGLVSFTVPQGYYYITITHRYNNPAFVFTNADEEGGNKKILDKDQKRFEATIVVSPAPIDYKVRVSNVGDTSGGLEGKTVVFYDMNGLPVVEAVTDENGIATLSAVNGSYYAVIKNSRNAFNLLNFVENREVTGEIKIANMEAGADKAAALPVFDTMTCELWTAPPMWFTLVNGYKKQLVIETTILKVTYNGKTYSPVNGVLTVNFTEKDGEAAFFTIESTAPDSRESFVLTVSTPGSLQNPIQLDPTTVNGQKLSVPLGANEVV